MCLCFTVSILHISMIFLFDFGTVPTVWCFLFYYFNTLSLYSCGSHGKYMFLKQNVRSLRRRQNAICFGCFVLCCGMMRFERKV